MHDLVGLPLDVKSLVFGHVRKRKDLKALYETCKDFYEIVIPRMYRTVTLSECIDTPKLCALLNGENRGLRYVRHVHIMPCKTCDGMKCSVLLHMLTHQLPRDVLASFTIDTTRHIAETITATLHQRQQRLRTLRVDNSLSNGRWDKHRGTKTEFITTIQLYIDLRRTLLQARKFISVCSRLQCLEIYVHMAAYCANAHLECSQEVDRATASKDIIAALIGVENSNNNDNGYSNKNAAKEGEHRCLSTLRFSGMSMSGVGTHLLQGVDMRQLTSLGFRSCERETSLLEMLATAEGGKCERLRHLAIVRYPENGITTDGDGSISDFISSFDSLESLIISAPETPALRPNLVAVAKHKKNLRTLYLDCKFAKWWETYPCKDVEESLSSCEKLEQLALNFPTICLYPEDCDETIIGIVDSLIARPTIHTLRILASPDYEDTQGVPLVVGESGQLYVETSMKSAARYIFRALPNVTALSIGRSALRERSEEEFQDFHQFYGRGKITDPDGNSTLEQIEIPWRDLREIESASDLLNLNLDNKTFVRYGQKD